MVDNENTLRQRVKYICTVIIDQHEEIYHKEPKKRGARKLQKCPELFLSDKMKFTKVETW